MLPVLPDSVVMVTEWLLQWVGHWPHGFEIMAEGGWPDVEMAFLAGVVSG